MAYDPSATYPAQVNAPSAGYPFGSPRNDATPGDRTGTPLENRWLGDVWAFLHSLLVADGTTPNGSADTTLASQYYSSLVSRITAISDAGIAVVNSALDARLGVVEPRLPDAARGTAVAKAGFIPLGNFAPYPVDSWDRVSGAFRSLNADPNVILTGSEKVPIGFTLTSVTLVSSAPVHTAMPSATTFVEIKRNIIASGVQHTLASGYDTSPQATYEVRHASGFTVTSADATFTGQADELEVSIRSEYGTNALPYTYIYGLLYFGTCDRGRII